MPKQKTSKQIGNDNISASLQKIIGGIPAAFKDKDEFFDLVSWNLRWFNAGEPQRVKLVAEVLGWLNADIFVLEEIEPGSLDEAMTIINKNQKGIYKVHYGLTGGDQRIAIMYDTEWIRAKDDITELFGKGSVKTGDNKEVFPRLPLKGYFLAKSTNPANSGFTFQLVGLHLKSQVGGGSSQRRMGAEKLAWWLQKEANDLDADTIMIGDWNKDPADEDWNALHQLEDEKKVKFRAINDSSDVSHLYYVNKNEIGSRLDAVLVSTDAFKEMKGKKAEAVHWVAIDELLKNASGLSTIDIKKVMANIKDNLSDHMPLHVRYYQKDNDK